MELYSQRALCIMNNLLHQRVFFLYVVKCDTLARRTGYPLNTLMFHQGRGSLL